MLKTNAPGNTEPGCGVPQIPCDTEDDLAEDLNAEGMRNAHTDGEGDLPVEDDPTLEKTPPSSSAASQSHELQEVRVEKANPSKHTKRRKQKHIGQRLWIRGFPDKTRNWHVPGDLLHKTSVCYIIIQERTNALLGAEGGFWWVLEVGNPRNLMLDCRATTTRSTWKHFGPLPTSLRYI
jgi:hypothetical protein